MGIVTRIPQKAVLVGLMSSYRNTEIAMQYGVSPSTVHLWCKKYRICRGYAKKLTEEDVRNIRALVQEGLYQKDIAEKFEVDGSVISDVVNYVTWKHVN